VSRIARALGKQKNDFLASIFVSGHRLQFISRWQSFVEILATMGIDFARREAGTVKPDLRLEDYRAELAGNKLGDHRALPIDSGVSATAAGSTKTFDNRTGRSAASAYGRDRCVAATVDDVSGE
jgi:hypothetical protein